MPSSFHKGLRSKPFCFQVGSNREQIFVHSDLLAACSEPLSLMVEGPMREAREGVATIEDVDVDTFLRLVEYIYTGTYTEEEPVRDPFEGELGDEGVSRNTLGKATLNALGRAVAAGESSNQQSFSTPAGDETPRDYFFRPNGRVDPDPLRKSFAQEILTRPAEFQDFVPWWVTSPTDEFGETFLSHARLYVLADRYGVQRLKELVLSNLHCQLLAFKIYTARVGDIIDLIRYVFNPENTADNNVNEPIDELRELILKYIVCIYDELVSVDGFLRLVEGGGCLSRDLMVKMRGRVRGVPRVHVQI